MCVYCFHPSCYLDDRCDELLYKVMLEKFWPVVMNEVDHKS